MIMDKDTAVLFTKNCMDNIGYGSGFRGLKAHGDAYEISIHFIRGGYFRSIAKIILSCSRLCPRTEISLFLNLNLIIHSHNEHISINYL